MSFSHMERRLQDLESHIDNMFRVGTIIDTKFDDEKKRWYVKIGDKMPDKEKGQSSTAVDANPNFQSDWLPWQTFAHGTIKITMPPRKGMRAAMKSPFGKPEMGYVEHFHNHPDAKSPSGDPDKVHIRVEKPTDKTGSGSQQESDPDQTLDMVFTKDLLTTKLGKSTTTVSKDTITHVSGDGKQTVIIDKSGMRLENASGKVHLKTDGHIVAQNQAGGILHIDGDDGTIFMNSTA